MPKISKLGLNPLINPLIGRCKIQSCFLKICSKVNYHYMHNSWFLQKNYLTDSNQNIWRRTEKLKDFYSKTHKKCCWSPILSTNQYWIKNFLKYVATLKWCTLLPLKIRGLFIYQLFPKKCPKLPLYLRV